MPDEGHQTLEPTLADQLELDRITFDPANSAPRFDTRARSKVFQPVPWPEGLKPEPVKVDSSAEMPKADLLIVTYTTAEGYALADVLTPGVDTGSWMHDTAGWPEIKALIEGDRAPSLKEDCAGYWAVTKIGKVTAVLIKSNLHPATDGSKLPIVSAWKKWVAAVQPKLVITTGTAGAVQHDTLLGDVVVSNRVSWDCTQRFKNQPFAGQKYESPVPIDDAWFTEAEKLIVVNATQLPPNPAQRSPRVWTGANIITTDHFAFDDADDRYGLQAFDKLARAVEMDDAACAEALNASTKTPWLAIRNASDPQMDDPNLAQEAKLAAAIYERFGQVTSWGSALACWAVACNLSEAVK